MKMADPTRTECTSGWECDNNANKVSIELLKSWDCRHFSHAWCTVSEWLFSPQHLCDWSPLDDSIGVQPVGVFQGSQMGLLEGGLGRPLRLEHDKAGYLGCGLVMFQFLYSEKKHTSGEKNK